MSSTTTTSHPDVDTASPLVGKRRVLKIASLVAVLAVAALLAVWLLVSRDSSGSSQPPPSQIQTPSCHLALVVQPC